jgi:hypothetical protein
MYLDELVGPPGLEPSRLWTPPNCPEQRKRPEHPYRPEQRKRPESGRLDTVQLTLSVKNLDTLHGSNCVVF